MIRRFLVFSLSLLGLFIAASYLQQKLPEPFRVFPTTESYIPPNPLRPFIQAYNDFSQFSSASDSRPQQPQSDKANDELTNTEAKDQEPKSVESRPILISGPDFDRLQTFFEALKGLEKVDPKGTETRTVRILHFGDSIMWGDNLSLKMKQLFQKDFMDGGRGLVNIIDSPSSELKEHDNETRRGFRIATIPFESFTMPLMPVLGFSGGSATPTYAKSVTSHTLPDASMAPWQRVRIIIGHPERLKNGDVTRPLTYLVQANVVKVDGSKSTIERNVTVQGNCSVAEIDIPESRKLELSVIPQKETIPFPIIDGLFLENTRGVSYSAIVKMGIHLAWMSMIPEDVLICGLKAANPDLLIYQYGVNESASLSSNYRGFTKEKYESQLREYFRRVRKALPETPVLIVGPFERLLPSAAGPKPSEAQLIVREVQMQLASEFKFAYFDSYEYLGGEGQMQTMFKNGEAISDYTHLTRSGGDRLAQGIYDALITHYLIYSGNLDSKNDFSISADFKDHEDLYSYQPRSITDRDASPGAIAFHSMDFAYFLFIVVLGATILLRYPALRLIFLILASYYFYASWKLWPVSLMLFSTVLDYYCGMAIARARERSGTAYGTGGIGGTYLLISLAGNLGLLFFFKYFDFVAHLLNQGFQASGWEITVPALGLLLPVGISFYTFQTLSYTIDVYRGTLPVEKNFLRFSLYVTFFPQLVAGPIVRASEFIPDIKKGIYHFLPNHTDFNLGVFQFLGGLIKKMTADWLAYGLIDRVYQNPEMFTSAETLIVFYAYGLQIYGDFSGYTDMALGAARLLGFRLTDNFNRPYQSASISEFWRRWHISLGSWFRDYVYISLGGNRFYMYRNLFITMFLAGLWHGAGIMFVAWGIYHGLFLMLERIPDAIRRRRSGSTGKDTALGNRENSEELGTISLKRNRDSAANLWLRRAITLHLVLIGWVLFRSHDVDQFLDFFGSLFPAEFFSSGQWSIPNTGWTYLLVVILAYMYHLTPVRFRQKAADLWDRTPLPVQLVSAFLLLTGLFQISVRDVQPFIYFQF
ncbi:MAG: MBOAT family O-acyltransferase [Leptospiraceae bacterium]